MSATISPSPSPVAPTAQIALNTSASGEIATGDAGGASGTGGTGSPGSFAKLFQQLSDKQLAANLSQDQIMLPTVPVAAVEAATASDSLTALLPFLEAMGLIPPTAAGTNTGNDIDDAEMSAEEITDASLLAGIAPALTPQLTPAANTAAISAGNTPQVPLPAATEGQPHLEIPPALIAAGQESALTAAEQGVLLTTEFSSRLAAAQEALGEKPANQLPAAVVAPSASAATLQTSITATPVLPVEQPVGASGWGQEVGNRVVWMANRMESRAELVLTPPQMGRVEVSLSISGDQANASFVSANPQVREALEAAMPRLREILADAGIQLGQAQVGAENPHQSAQQEKNGDNFGLDHATKSTGSSQQTSATALPVSPGLKIGRGLVDVFA